MTRRVSSPVFIGRRSELDRLEAALASAKRREPQLVLVAGDAGIGKTRLVAEFAARARASGCEVLSGGCVPVGDVGVPFAAVTEALRGVARSLGRAGFEALAGPGRGELARLVPDFASAAPDVSEPPAAGGWAQARMFELLLGFLGRLAVRSPVLFIIEDLQWADEGTRGLISYLVHNLADERLLLLATVRADDLHRRHPLVPLLAELRRAPRVDRIDLVPFDGDELAEQLAGILGSEPEPGLVAEIAQRSQGNAYLTEELAAVGPGARLPGTLEDVLLARMDRLGQGAQELLRVASAAGSRIDTGLLTEVACGIVGDPLPAIRELVDEGVLVRVQGEPPGERHAFRHALLQEAVYGRLLAAERAGYHEAFARALAAEPGPVDPSTASELAHHWEGAHDLPRAFGASVEAGRAAAGMFAFADALRLFERALALWDRVPDAEDRAGMDRAGLLELSAIAATAAGDAPRAVLHFRAAVELVDGDGDPVRAGLLNEHLGRYAWDAGEPLESLAAAREAVRLVPSDPPSVARARVLGGLARALTFMVSAEEGADIAREAIAVAAVIGARDVEADALVTLSLTLSDGGAVGNAVSALRRARDMAMEIGDDHVAVRAWSSLLATLNVAADLDSSATEGSAAAAWVEEHGRTQESSAILMFNYVHALYQLGRWDEAERLVRRVHLATPQGEYALLMPMALIHLEIGRGDVAAAARRLESARGLVGRGDDWERVVIADLAAQIALADGDLREARRLAQGGLPELPFLARHDTNIYCYILFTALRVEAKVTERARARGATRELDEATVRGSRIVREGRSITASIATDYPELRNRPTAVLALCEAEWSRLPGQSDVGLWATAATACELARQLHLRPYALYRQAEAMLAAKADRAAAAALLREAHAVVVAMGARPLQHEIEALAERARIRLEPAAPAVSKSDAPAADRTGLTPREREVLSLVAAGRTNRQIAEALFISEKTAGVHVSNILGKLGASGRTEAAAIAHRLGLVG